MNSIVEWLRNYSKSAGDKTFVVGISGGVDSALTSTLCAETGIDTWVLSMPIHQEASQLKLALGHIEWLKNKYSNTIFKTIDLSEAYNSFTKTIPDDFDSDLGLANTRARLRMTALYQVATAKDGLVVGTGNKIEDFGVGFFTKYGDGGVDINPIAHLLKSEVRQMALKLGILNEIVTAPPTDGLWADSRTDEEQLGATYDELEWAMQYKCEGNNALTDRQREVLRIYNENHSKNRHKMIPIPTFENGE